MRDLPSFQRNGQGRVRADRPLFYGGADPITINKFEQLVNNYRTMQSNWLERGRGDDPSQDPRRDLADECGYPKHQWTSEEYHDLIMSEPLACLANELYPVETMEVIPEIYETDEEDVDTDWELAFAEFLKGSAGPEPSYLHQEQVSSFWSTLLCADILMGEGRHGGVLIGLKDGKRLDEPASRRKGQKVTFLQAFPEYLCRVSSYDLESSSSRFMMPERYSVTFSDPHEVSTGSSASESYTTEEVHHTRLVHLTDRWHTASSSRNYAIPRLRVVRDPILDYRKVRGSSAEMYYKGAFFGLHFGTHPQLGADVNFDVDAMRDMYEEYQNGLQRGLFTKGMTADPLSPTVITPDPQALIQLQSVAMKLRCPLRKLLGNEIGDLASTDDKFYWNSRKKARQQGHSTPSLIAPVVNRLINLGCLPEPEMKDKKSAVAPSLPRSSPVETERDVNTGKKKDSGGYRVRWPDIATQTEKEKAEVLLIRTQAYVAYVAGNVMELIPPLDYMVKWDSVNADDAQQMLDEAEELQIEKDEEAAALADEAGLIPDMTEEGFKEPTPEPDPDGELDRAIKLEQAKAKARPKPKPPGKK